MTVSVNGIERTPAHPDQKSDVRNRARISQYTQFWKTKSSEDTERDNDHRIKEYESVTNSYYDGATDLYEYGWGKNFHFARYYPGEAFQQALARHEHYLSASTGLKEGMRVLDVGCGVGGPAREIAVFSDCKIVGVNNNEYQVRRANKYNAAAGLSHQIEVVKGDFMNLVDQFGENSFDAVYAIEATCHAPSWEGVYGQIMKVLKPGGKFGVYEWCMTDKYDKNNPEHRKISHGIEIGDGIAEMRTIAQARTALKTVGFEILREEDLAARDDQVPWYYPLRGNLRECQSVWDYATVIRMTWFGKIFTQSMVRVLEGVGLAPKGTYDIGEALKLAADALVAGAEAKVFTPMMLFVCKKPEN
ncbi:hypothetical protein MJO28_002735 [Puccinia striiformis f. sp. tritici]|uniref:Sterol 24-C-methyltransferase n=4 Tax=Puccinia striiformis TaxID=27350 RepID=A0A0L0V1N0_9BASI|nr:hypothetical protein Pst134EA_005301 [Puccinia striiformis f. sp. tritici]KAI9619204.1 hypothetical protein H4Q26_011885 [Puccinia striiformis f. sp. tritici PST-130]KNE93170.1 sterol 24-C-methyltransferase [Puccinia striiformis f. sp. tritici PST-78]POW10734.1 hypothetical protein PSTT_05857 [Puccinia striiformis]AEM61135.1 sterol 24-C-methyltransferase [Puccinia striiformis f. sp. tritici]KAH9462497.1 hypothetical protein Pst134EB_006389 [Puccinia striiformis f. sp. tritici]